jgi:hypothetical protein
LLAVLEKRQENVSPIWEFQRVMMGGRVFYVDLMEDRSSVVESSPMPKPKTLTSDVLREGQFRAG